MLIKYHALASKLKNKLAPVYLIFGTDQYLQNEIANQIKQTWRKQGEVDEQIIDIDDDWDAAFATANSYSLFNELQLLDIRFSKKNISSNCKDSLLKYLSNYNSTTTVIIRAPNLNYKQLDFLKQNIQICSAQPFTNYELETWIKAELRRLNIICDANIVKIIIQYSQNNMLAAHQTITKIAMLDKDKTKLSTQMLLEFITDQSDYPIYALSDACLLGKAKQAITILHKFAHNNQTTFVYILWILSNEIRILTQLKQMVTDSSTLQTACNKLKIWPQKVKQYEVAEKRFTLGQLEVLLKHCAHLDFKLKSSTEINIWDKLENLVLLLCRRWETHDKILVNEI